MAEARAPQMVNITMPDGTHRAWDMAHEPKPDSVGNGSRNGFLYNCYTHPLGRFFQNTIKTGILSVIKRIHDKEIPRYDKQAYVFDDPRLKNLAGIIRKTLETNIDDNDAERKREIANNAAEIVEFMMKEDIFYRMEIFLTLQEIGKDYALHPEHYALTDPEQFIYDKFNGMGNHSTQSPEMKAFTFEKWKSLRDAGLPSKPVMP